MAFFFSWESEVDAQSFLMHPTTISVERHWSIPEDEPIGTRVAHARVDEADPTLEFSIEASEYMDGSSFFRIDPTSGAIYLNESMQGRVKPN